MPELFDFVIVGSGAGGGPLAARLALAGFRVLVLEAGSHHDCPYYSVPIMQAYASEDPDMRWDFFVRHWDDDCTQVRDPKFVTDRGGVLYPRGSTVGGSTAVSAMVTMYPHRSDWQRIADRTGDDSWAPDKMREYFRALESWQGVDAERIDGEADPGHGMSGWLGTTRANPALAGREPKFLEIIEAIENTCRERLGVPESIPLPRDINAVTTPDDFQGMTYVPVAVRNGHRNGSRERLLEVAAQYPDRLTIRTDSLVTRVLFEADKAVGVEYRTGRKLYQASALADCPFSTPETTKQETQTATATREVILAGGAFNTPQLLMLSGIGPRAELGRHNIEVKVDAPGVGANLQDRYEVSVVSEFAENYEVFEGSALDVPAPNEKPDPLCEEWRDTNDGPYSTNGSLAAIVARSSVAADGSDLVVFALPIDFHGYYPGYSKDVVRHHDRLSIVVLKAHTNNRAGTVRLRSADPTEPPDIRFHYFDEGSGSPDHDLRGVVDGIRIARDVNARLGTHELIPGSDLLSDNQLNAFVKEQAWGHHACGTARIGTAGDEDAVVDSDFRVRGVTGLRVVDASVFPDIPGLFIALPVYMISEKAADVIIAEHSG